jgi:hypothetical protein
MPISGFGIPTGQPVILGKKYRGAWGDQHATIPGTSIEMGGHNTIRRDTKLTDSLMRPDPADAAAWFLDYGHMMDKVLDPSATSNDFYPDIIGLERPIMPPLTEDPGTANMGTTTAGLTGDRLAYWDTQGLLPLAKRNMNPGKIHLDGLN